MVTAMVALVLAGEPSWTKDSEVDGSSIERRVKVPASGQHTELIHWRADTATRSQAR